MSDNTIGTEELNDTDQPITLAQAFEGNQDLNVFAGAPEEDSDEFEEDDDKAEEDKAEEDEKNETSSDNKQEKDVSKETETFEYASQEEAEKALKAEEKRKDDARAKMHEALQEAAQLRKDLESLQKAKDTAKDTEKEKALEKDIEEEQAAIYAKMHEKIDELDTEDSDFYKKMGKIQSDADKSIEALKQKKRDAETVEEEASKKAVEDAEAARDREAKEVYDRAIKGAEKAGLDMRVGISKSKDGTPVNSLDYDLFWDCTHRAKGSTFEERLEWTVAETNRIKGVIKEDAEALKKKAQEKQKENKILEKGSTTIPGSEDEDEKPLSVMAAFGKNRKTL